MGLLPAAQGVKINRDDPSLIDLNLIDASRGVNSLKKQIDEVLYLRSINGFSSLILMESLFCSEN